MMLLEEVDECITKVECESSADLDLVVRQVKVDGDLIKFFDARMIWIHIISLCRL